MASLGSLVVSLAANTAQFTSAMDKAAYQQGKRMEQMRKDAETVGKAIGAALVIGAGALAVAVERITKHADTMGKEAQKVGESVEEFSRLTHAAEMSGASMEKLSIGMKKLNVGMAEVALTGKGPAAEAFTALRISVTNADGSLRAGSAVMSDVAARFAAMGETAQKTAFAVDIFGKSGTDLIPMLNAGAEGLAAMKQEADELGIVITESTFRAAEAFNDQLSRIQKTQEGVITQITAEMLPTMNMLADEFLEVSKNSELVANAAAVARTALEALIVVGGNVAFVFRGVATEAQGIQLQMKALARADFSGFSEIGRKMKEDAAKARAEFDAWEQRILNPPPVDMAALTAAADAKMEAARKVAMAEAKAQEGARKAAAGSAARQSNAKRAASEADREAKRAADLRRSLIASIEREAETFGSGARSAKLYELALAGASKTQIAAAKATIDSIEAMERQRDLGGQYGATMGQIASAIETADNSTRDLDAAQASLLDLMRSPDWAKMPEAWQQTAIAQTAAASSAIKAAEAQAWLKSTMAATPTAVLDMARERMKFLADEYERGRFGIVGSEQAMRKFGEVANTALGNVADEARKTNSAMDEFALQAARNTQDVFADFLFDPFKDGLDGMLSNFGRMLQRMIAEAVAADLANRIFGAPSGNGSSRSGGWIDLAMTAASAYFGGTGGGGASAPANISRGGSFSPSFAGGGSTGIGPRAGGIDGKGGFNAVLHPNETVIDHSKNQTVGATQNVNITINMPSGTPAETRRAAGAGAREALGAFSSAQRYA
jgi:hypothetical protein